MPHEKLRTIGWNPFFQRQVAPELPADRIARVSSHHGSQILLLGADGEFGIPTQLTESVGEIAVGDWLVLDEDNRAIERLERQTVLTRRPPGKESTEQVIVSNVGTLFIVSSCNQDFNLSRIERYLALTVQCGAMPIVVLTKADLCDNATELRRQVEKLRSGLLVETLDARDPQQAELLSSWCGLGQSVALLGSSGVGKTTLANALGAGDLSTGDIREKDGKGRHTTTVRSLHQLPAGGILIDTPGMRELQLLSCEDGVAEVFDDVLQIAEGCRFSDCKHDGDAGCAIAAALESGELEERRFVSFKKLMAEQARNSRTLAERRARDRGFGRMIKSHLRDKQRRRDQP